MEEQDGVVFGRVEGAVAFVSDAGVGEGLAARQGERFVRGAYGAGAGVDFYGLGGGRHGGISRKEQQEEAGGNLKVGRNGLELTCG